MPKKHSPTFVTGTETTYAVNRAAKRLARRKKLPVGPVPLMPITVDPYDGSYVREIDGILHQYTAYYEVKS